ncbi:hypothetical protein YC2023_079181 [Brassica napus]
MGAGLDGQSCSCLIVGWPVGSFISNHGCWTVDRSCSCLIVGRLVDHMSRKVRRCYIGMKTLKWREFEAKSKPEAKEERQIQRTGLWYGLDIWTSSVVEKTKIEKDLRNLDKFVSWGIRVLWQRNSKR